MSIQSIPDEKVDVPEIPFQDNVRLPAKAAALIVVDMQNDFVDPDGTLATADAGKTVSRIARLIEAARAHDVHIAYTQDTHMQGDPEWDIWPEHCRKDTWGWEIVPELKPQPEDLICQKNRYDGFYGTWLDHFLSNVWHVQHLVIVGTVANICVLHTAASAGLRWFNVIVPADGISAQTTFDQALTLRQISWLYHGGVVRSIDDIAFE